MAKDKKYSVSTEEYIYQSEMFIVKINEKLIDIELLSEVNIDKDILLKSDNEKYYQKILLANGKDIKFVWSYKGRLFEYVDDRDNKIIYDHGLMNLIELKQKIPHIINDRIEQLKNSINILIGRWNKDIDRW